ncbi:SRPBCC family protein [Luteimonas mephitis]|uniref:SRPBCC family protein n=1 Tax=Luteimonas mephitis TaxID=83615 RepID=UPI00042A5FDD|nr:SRPBCC family protein [Luteimonas mephitis]
MTRLIEFLISFAIVIALMLIVGLVLPSSRHLSESVETNRKMTIVFDTINSLRRFKDWNPLVLRAPEAKLELSGPASGVGAKLSWESDVKQVGDGSWEIVESVPGKSVKIAIDDQRRGHDKFTEFKLTPTGRGAVKRNVAITQTYDVEYGWNLLGRYAGLYVGRHVGDDMKLGLARLSNMLATVPNVDYAVKGSKMRGMAEVQRPAEDLLVVKAGSIERNNETIKNSMKSNMEWIKRTMEANGLVAAGPMRIISTELGRENYTFDIAQPVRKAGSGDKKNDDAKDEKTAKADEKKDEEKPKDGELVFTVDTQAPVTAAGEPLDVKIPAGAPVEYVQTKPTRAAMAYYTGFMAELDNVRNALRAWALTQGYEVTDRPYEIYKNGIDKAFTAEGEYEVYWTLK